MSVAGLRYQPRTGTSGTPRETRPGSYIYNGDPASFHDWEFRTLMRRKLYEDAIRSRKKTDAAKSDATGTDDATSSDQPAEDEEPHTEPGDEAEDEEPADDEDGSPVKSGISTGKGKGLTKSKLKGLKGAKKRGVLSLSSKSGDMDETTSYARTEMVHRILEGLRDEAFELARDMGVESLTAPGGLRSFVEKMREVVFPCATEEARELFRAGQKHGVLSRQPGESMLSYVSPHLLKCMGTFHRAQSGTNLQGSMFLTSCYLIAVAWLTI